MGKGRGEGEIRYFENFHTTRWYVQVGTFLSIKISKWLYFECPQLRSRRSKEAKIVYGWVATQMAPRPRVEKKLANLYGFWFFPLHPIARVLSSPYFYWNIEKITIVCRSDLVDICDDSVQRDRGSMIFSILFKFWPMILRSQVPNALSWNLDRLSRVYR